MAKGADADDLSKRWTDLDPVTAHGVWKRATHEAALDVAAAQTKYEKTVAILQAFEKAHPQFKDS